MPKNEEYPGKFITVRIVKSGKHYMVGEPIQEGQSVKTVTDAYIFQLLNQYFKFFLAIVFLLVGMAISIKVF